MNILTSIKSALALVINSKKPSTDVSKTNDIIPSPDSIATPATVKAESHPNYDGVIASLKAELANKDAEILALKDNFNKKLINEINKRMLAETGIDIDRLPKCSTSNAAPKEQTKYTFLKPS